MKKKIVFLLVVFMALSTVVKAQMDSWMLNQWLNQMNEDTYRQQQKMANEFMKLLEEESKRNEANATAVCSLLPGGNDTFFALISAAYINLNNLEITQKPIGGVETRISPSNYFAVNGQIITLSVFAPGMSVMVKRKDTGKVLSQVAIPPRETSEYTTFLQNAYIMAQMYGTQGNAVSSGGASGRKSGFSTVRNTCSGCRGKGWIRGSSTPTYGTSGQHWCSGCGEYVNASHSHNRCPSCSGKGYIDNLR